jgi:glycosyltransferase involved in cell wall biosynthesis
MMQTSTNTRAEATPLISVIMPCYNAAPYVAQAVASVLEQTHGNVELIAVDDGSNDGSEAILADLAKTHPERVHLLYTSRAGPYPARNAGLKRARGQFIAFLDADDWWQPDTLEKLHAAMSTHDADIAYCGWQNVGDGITSEPYIPPAYETEDPVAHFLRTCPWPIHAALVRRELVQRLGGFSERRYASMDYDFWLRALGAGARIRRVPEVLAFYRWHNLGQVSAVKWRQVLDALEAQQAFIREHQHLVAHLPAERLRDLTEGQVLRQAYRAFWRRDLRSAQKLFRHVAARGTYRMRDLRHVLSALLPYGLYSGLVRLADRRSP